MKAHLFHATTKSDWQDKQGVPGSSQYVVSEGSSRSVAAGRAMRKVYALNRYATSLHSVSLRYLGTVEVAR